jgi:hypothetical protein
MIEPDYRPLLKAYQAITLQQLNSSAPLMHRVDKKFVMPIHLLSGVLEQCVNQYDILDIDGLNIFRYRSSYFDTQDLHSYHQHHSGKASRFKIRKRTYLESQESFWEIKVTNNKGFLQKTRLPVVEDSEPANLLWAKEYIGELAQELFKTITVTYERITLLSKDRTEKVTLDLNMSFEGPNDTCAYRNVVIAEVKKEKDRPGFFSKQMKEAHVQKGSMSKYCLGLITLQKDLKHNNFKRKFEKIKALNNYGN